MPELHLTADNDIAFDFEDLACAAFNCRRYADPFKIATQNEYSIDGTSTEPFSFRRPLSIVLHKLVFDYPASDELKAIEERIWEAKSQNEFVSIISDAIATYRTL